jgi:hypothetical protein
VQVIKSGRIRWTGHEASKGRGEACTGFWLGNVRERDRWGDPGIVGKIILRCIFRQWDVEVWIGLSWLRMGALGGYL